MEVFPSEASEFRDLFGIDFRITKFEAPIGRVAAHGSTGTQAQRLDDVTSSKGGGGGLGFRVGFRGLGFRGGGGGLLVECYIVALVTN